MADLINRDDTLNQGRVKLNESIKQSERAEVKADEALGTANEAKDQSESTQTQLDTIVIDGDSSVEAAQARVDEKGQTHSTLKDRIDDGFIKVNTQLADKVSKDEIKSRSESRGIDVIKDLGLDNSGVVDVSSELNGAMVPNKTFFFSEGTYFLGSKVYVPENIKLIGHNAKIIGEGFYCIGDHYHISGFEFIGNDLNPEHASIGLLFQSSSNVVVENNVFDKARLYAGFDKDSENKKNIRIINNDFKGNYLNFTGVSRPITILGYDTVLFTGNFVECESSGSVIKIQAGSELQNDQFNFIGENYTKNVVVTNNVFKGDPYSAISLYTGAGESVISNNVFNMGSSSKPSRMIIDGKSSGESNNTVHTNKIRRVIVANNVVNGFFSSTLFRIQGGYGMEWEGEEQSAIISNNDITNHFKGSVSNICNLSGLHSVSFSNNDVFYINEEDNYHYTLAISGCKTILASNNRLKTGSFYISNSGMSTIGDLFTGTVENISISNNIIEKWSGTGAVKIMISNERLKVVVNNNIFETDTFSSPNTFPIDTRGSNIKTMISTGNVAINTANDVAGDKPMLDDSIIGKHIDGNNTWNE